MVNVPRTPLEKAAKEMLQSVECMLRNGEWYQAQERADALRDALSQPERAALAQQAEPVESVAWVASKDGRVIYDDVSTNDVVLRVAGDFEDDEQRARYVQRIVDKLNATPPQRLPLTEEEIMDLCAAQWASHPVEVARAVEQAHGIGEKK